MISGRSLGFSVQCLMGSCCHFNWFIKELPQHPFPCDWDVTHTNYHWSNENSVIQYIKAVIIFCINGIQQDILKDEEQAALAIFDCFKGQVTKNVIDAWCARRAQHTISDSAWWMYRSFAATRPSVNRSAKAFLRSQFQKGYSQEIFGQLDAHDQEKHN